MIFPIGDVNVERGHPPVLTFIFIAINVLVILFEVSLGQEAQNQFVTTYGNIPNEIMVGKDLYTLLTSIFLHGGWMHLIGNMLFLWVFADNIEATIGHFKFFLFYIIGGVAASYGQAVLDPTSNIPSVGASGSISACLGAYLVMFPKSQIKVLFLLFFRSFYVSAIYFLGIWIVQQFISGFGSLSAATNQQGGVAYWAHIAGFVFGVAAGFVFKKEVKYNPNFAQL
jgi:membrane associated rhomboid family serine protease